MIPRAPFDLDLDNERNPGGLSGGDGLRQERLEEALEGGDAVEIGRKTVELFGEKRIVEVKKLRERVEDTEGLRFRHHRSLEEDTKLWSRVRSSPGFSYK